MTQLVVLLALTACSSACGIWILMFGWGLEPQSWDVIIGGFFVQMVITDSMMLIQGVNWENKG